MISHIEQLENFFKFLEEENIRYVCIRGFLLLPYTGDTDIDIIIHPDDFERCIDGMSLSKINKRFTINLINECIYEPCKTDGPVDESMSNGCFRVDLYNNIFFHCGKYKYQAPLYFLDIIFNTKIYNIPNIDLPIYIPDSEIEILLLMCRAIIDKNKKAIQKKHINRIEELIEDGIDNRLLNMYITSICITDNSGQMNRCINNNYFSGYKIEGIIKERILNDKKEDTLKEIIIDTTNLMVYQDEILNKKSSYVLIEDSNEYNYVYNNKNKEYYWRHYSQQKFDNLIINYNPDKYTNINITNCYSTNYRNVWYDALKRKYISYYYYNNECVIVGEYITPWEASDHYNIEAYKIFNYTLNRSKVVERPQIFQIRDGIHRSVINYPNKIHANFVYNLGRRPMNLPLEHEYHSFILWNNSNAIEELLYSILDNTRDIKICYTSEISILDRAVFINNIYRKEREFYNFQDEIPKSDIRIKKTNNIKLIVIKDFIPTYIESIKQGKNLPLNKKIKSIKNKMREEYTWKDIHSSDNISEHNAIIESLMIDQNLDLKMYIN